MLMSYKSFAQQTSYIKVHQYKYICGGYCSICMKKDYLKKGLEFSFVNSVNAFFRIPL